MFVCYHGNKEMCRCVCYHGNIEMCIWSVPKKSDQFAFLGIFGVFLAFFFFF